jgi:ectoine hydroxylase-related dioxygenase (phytanoyl-CoA dioxygenase family)
MSDGLISTQMRAHSPESVAASIRDKGYMVLREALTPECVARINQETGDLRPDYNANWAGPVLFKNQRYMTHCLANSGTIFDLMTRSWCFDVLRAYFGANFRLTDQRVYVTEREERMQWHVDNKFDDSAQSEYPGLIFIFYLCDVDDGELQVIDGSNRWSKQHPSADFSDAFIDANHAKDIVSLKMPAGSGLVYDTSVIHRAHRIRRSGWERKSLFFQVEKKVAGGEPILIDARFARDLTPEQEYFLGFGAMPEYGVFPTTSTNTVRPTRLLKQAGRLAAATVRASIMAPLWGLSFDRRDRLKRLFGRPKTGA